MTRSADFSLAVGMACTALRDAGIGSFPVSLKQILRHYGIRLLSYEAFCRANECSAEDCFSWFGKDASSIRGKDHALILYNESRTPSLRIRFSIAHEIGHILLGHHKEASARPDNRTPFDHTLYKVQEAEANCFARNLLCPAPAVYRLFRTYHYFMGGPDDGKKRMVWICRLPAAERPGMNLNDAALLERAFLLSPTAAGTRLRMLEEDFSRMDRENAVRIRQEIKDTAILRCRECGAPRVPKASACYACGSRGRFGFFPSDVGTSPPPAASHRKETLRVNTCPVCGKNSHAVTARYCTNCGINLTNDCEGTATAAGERMNRHANPSFAHYCLRCGKPTTFHLLHLLEEDGTFTAGPEPEPKRKKPAGVNPDLFFPYPDFPLPRSKSCPRCGTDNPEARTDCRVCCCPLDNTCSSCEAKNSQDSRFCALCGKPTPFERYHAFDPEVRKREKAYARQILAKFESRGLYYEWDNGPMYYDF